MIDSEVRNMSHLLSVINNTKHDLKKYQKKYNEILLETLKVLKIKDEVSLSVSFVSSYMIKKYNREYRNIDKVTDVISFAMEDSECYFQDDNRELGDIFICYDRALKQSKEYGHSLERELSFLFTHGLLHLLGYDHMEKEDEEIMFGLQEKILKNLGVNR